MTDPLARVSIVIPVGPGDTTWAPLLAALRKNAAEAELLPVFAEGDFQHTPPGAIFAPAGRATQQNAGADAAQREWLWLVHADTRLTAEALPALRSWLAREERALGWFRLRFADDGPQPLGLRLVRSNARGANWRARVLGLPFGDQGLILPRADFDRLGGFDETLTCGEDHALVWRARRAGLPLAAIDAELITSARKYADSGWLRTSVRHLGLTAVQAWRESRR